MYTISITRAAQRALGRIHHLDYIRIVTAIQALAANPRPPGCVKLTGREGWRIRVGTYRVIYEIDDEPRIVMIVDVATAVTSTANRSIHVPRLYEFH